jgi:hypothetical protein
LKICLKNIPNTKLRGYWQKIHYNTQKH